MIRFGRGKKFFNTKYRFLVDSGINNEKGIRED